MAVKKSELYSSLWDSCNELRGGMDSSLYKDYILTLLFVKYVTDKFKGDRYAEIEIPEDGSFLDMIAAKGKNDIGDKMNKIISKLAEANGLGGVIDIADFDDDGKLGSGSEKIEKLTNLIAIFQNESLDFRKNKAGGDDIIGDAYEYLMKHFATESGKSKGQFYTPAEVSRIMAKVIGVNGATTADQTIYDPACGSGSLLIRANDEAKSENLPDGITIYGQEFDVNTAGLAQMNLVLHNKSTGIIANANTLSNPIFKNGDSIERFDFAVANPPFSYSSWGNGIDVTSDERFAPYNAVPPDKNGDYAWLIHFIHSLKPQHGKGAIILPHGVLFRGNAEAIIRKEILDKKIIKGIIGLPANLFFGTGIPACIIIIDKENAAARKGLFIIDASRGFIKDGNKNSLREQDIRKIVDSFNNFIEIPKYSRNISYSEIKANDYNLNIPRYIDGSEPEDLQSISAHLFGGLPQRDIDELSPYWEAFPTLQSELFENFKLDRTGYVNLKVAKDDIQSTIYGNGEFIEYENKIEEAFNIWKANQWTKLNEIKIGDKPKSFIVEVSNALLSQFSNISLIDKYDVYQCIMSYWEQSMQDDLYAITFDGWESGNEIEREMVKKKDGTTTGKMKSFEGKIIPKRMIIDRYFHNEQLAITYLENERDEVIRLMNGLKEEHSGEESLLCGATNDKGNISKSDLQKRIKQIKTDKDFADELKMLEQYEKLMVREGTYNTNIKKAIVKLEKVVFDKYKDLSIDEIKDIVVETKWCKTIFESINAIYSAISHSLTNRISEIVARYDETLSNIEDEVEEYEATVKSHLERMGFLWK